MNFRKSRAAHLQLGRAGERAAARWLELRQCRILARNFRNAGGELDLVVRDGGVTVFVEVKSLRERSDFSPIGNLSNIQRRRNRAAAEFFLALLPRPCAAYRFDLIEVVFRRRRVVTLRRHRDYLEPGGAVDPAQALARRPFWGYII